ncbi:hypothetical protein CCAX7_55500 [Capsulimonas corticalis]|uniref:Uncharacterized protein n=1 Tax=Capsulimonas corticalis TaxID=2219043 RepID=A0A402D0Z1_9BACT|nr:hypothetical protein [Capsulimonas corticalis]BDI33499.1 hypothetical protein CCAX7_55500 [Capsulimonas corticalis]
MHALIRDIVDYEENHQTSPLLMAIIQKYGRKTAHLICSELAGWLLGQARLKTSFPAAKNEFRPLKLDPTKQRDVTIRQFIDDSVEASELFETTEMWVDFRVEITLEERFAIARYVEEHYHPRLFVRPPNFGRSRDD